MSPYILEVDDLQGPFQHKSFNKSGTKLKLLSPSFLLLKIKIEKTTHTLNLVEVTVEVFPPVKSLKAILSCLLSASWGVMEM